MTEKCAFYEFAINSCGYGNFTAHLAFLHLLKGQLELNLTMRRIEIEAVLVCSILRCQLKVDRTAWKLEMLRAWVRIFLLGLIGYKFWAAMLSSNQSKGTQHKPAC